MNEIHCIPERKFRYCERQNIKFQTKMKKKQTRMSDFCPECINSTTGSWMNDIHSRVLGLGPCFHLSKAVRVKVKTTVCRRWRFSAYPGD